MFGGVSIVYWHCTGMVCPSVHVFAFKIRALTHPDTLTHPQHTHTFLLPPSSFPLTLFDHPCLFLKVLCDTAIVSAIVLLKRPSTDAFSTSWRTFVFHGGALWAAGFASRKLNIALKILIVYYERNTFSPKVRERERERERRGRRGEEDGGEEYYLYVFLIRVSN